MSAARRRTRSSRPTRWPSPWTCAAARPTNDLFDRLAADGRLGLDRAALEALVAEPIEFTGAARDQVARVVDRIEVIAAQHPGAATYTPGAIL